MSATLTFAYGSERHSLRQALILSGVVFWLLTALLVSLFSNEYAAALLIGPLALGLITLLCRFPSIVLYLLIGLGPFYDIARSFLFPGAELLGFWQDALVGVLALVAIRNVTVHGRPRIVALDRFVFGFIAAYMVSIAVSSNLLIWFYGFRWFVLSPVMYLALRTYPFTAVQRRRFVLAIAVSLSVSAILGLFAVQYFGWDRLSDLYLGINRVIMRRNDEWRWQATFMSSIIASVAFALLFLTFAALARFARRKLPWVLACGFALYALYLTRSRSGIVVAAAGILSILIAARVKYAKTLLGIAVLASLVLTVHLVQTFDEFDSLRIAQFTRTIYEAATEYPFGTGAGTAGSVSQMAAAFAGLDSDSVDFVVGDSVALTVLRDTGWFGLFCFVGICACSISVAWRARASLVGLLALAVWIGSAVDVMNAVDIYPVRLYLWLLAALAATQISRLSPIAQQPIQVN
ncbi:MAG TPA: hypothetical protein VMT39_00060 [Candidatus Bathyarchaeia archaeon]|nr:hypothetical protein [Candidatus Bathyarchaeia archaeon]